MDTESPGGAAEKTQRESLERDWQVAEQPAASTLLLRQSAFSAATASVETSPTAMEVLAASTVEMLFAATKFVTITAEVVAIFADVIARGAVEVATVAVDRTIESVVIENAVAVGVISIAVAIPRVAPVIPPISAPPSAAGIRVIPTGSTPGPTERPIQQAAETAEIDIYVRASASAAGIGS